MEYFSRGLTGASGNNDESTLLQRDFFDPFEKPDESRPEQHGGIAVTMTSNPLDSENRLRENPASEPVVVARRRRSFGWVWFLLFCLAAGAGVWWYMRSANAESNADKKGGAGKPVPVVVVEAKTGTMPIYLTGLGSVTALNTVTIRTRVDGELDSVNFIEGQLVKKGDLLVQIDPRPFQVQLTQAQGQLAKDEAALKNAKLDLERDHQAAAAIPQQQLATQEALVSQDEAAIKIDEGQIASAQLNLTYSRITAPISGRIGLRMVDEGNIVHATDANGLAVITQLQPITVVFSLPQDDIPQMTRRLRQGSPPVVDAYDRSLTTKLASGTLLALDNQVDPASGTIRIKASFPNEDNVLFPNQFVNARLLVDVRANAVLVPSLTIQRGPESTFVYVLQKDHTVKVQNIVVGHVEGDLAAIDSGIAPGEMIVTEGVDKLEDGTKVTSRTRATTQHAVPTTNSAAAMLTSPTRSS